MWRCQVVISISGFDSLVPDGGHLGVPRIIGMGAVIIVPAQDLVPPRRRDSCHYSQSMISFRVHPLEGRGYRRGRSLKLTFNQLDLLAFGSARGHDGTVLCVHTGMARGHRCVEARQQFGDEDCRAGDAVEDGVEHSIHTRSNSRNVEILCAIIGSGVYQNDVRQQI